MEYIASVLMWWTGRAWLRDAHCVPEYRDAEGEEPHNNWSELLRFRDPLRSAGEWRMSLSLLLLLFSEKILNSGWWIAGSPPGHGWTRSEQWQWAAWCTGTSGGRARRKRRWSLTAAAESRVAELCWATSIWREPKVERATWRACARIYAGNRLGRFFPGPVRDAICFYNLSTLFLCIFRYLIVFFLFWKNNIYSYSIARSYSLFSIVWWWWILLMNLYVNF